jgi:diacylglycerol kinase family enzyme
MVSRAVVDEGFRTLVCVGGDGTFNEVASGICRSGLVHEVRLGILPSGTANDQAGSFGISSAPRAIENNVKTIAEGHTTRLDVGELTTYYDTGGVLSTNFFFDSVGWGLSAAILATRNKDVEVVKRVPLIRDMYRDKAVFLRAATQKLAKSLITHDRFTAEVKIDGVEHTLRGLTDLLVNNTPLYAGEWLIDPESRYDDGKVELTPFCGLREWLSKAMIHYKRFPVREQTLARFGIKHSATLSGSEIEIELLRPQSQQRIPVELDGEEVSSADHFGIRIYKRMLNLIVPKGFHWI